MPSLEKLRRKVRSADRKIIEHLGKRMAAARKIGERKIEMGIPVHDPVVEETVHRNARRAGLKAGLTPELVAAVISDILAHSRLAQERMRNRRKGDRLETTFSARSRHTPSPREFRTALPISMKARATVSGARKSIRDILAGKEGRTIIVMGPCSIHETDSAIEYAGRMRSLQEKVADRFLLVIRAYFEKSRTFRGWTGFLSDPYLDGSGNIQEGVTRSRKLLIALGELGIPAAAEFINPVTWPYIGDLVSYTAVGARTSGSQLHRDFASGLDIPVGFKNSPDGSIDAALGAVVSATSGHEFLGIDDMGAIRAFKTRGNRFCHLILRGGKTPNYGARNVAAAQKALKAAMMRPTVIIDCSHGNSGKLARNQEIVFNDVIGQIAQGNNLIVGLMLESHLNAGRQAIPEKLTGFDASCLRHGISVTDECLDWDSTEKLICDAFDRLSGK